MVVKSRCCFLGFAKTRRIPELIALASRVSLATSNEQCLMARRATITTRPLWTCPKCDRQFVNTSMQHSCGRYSVRQFLDGKSANAVSLYQHFNALIHRCGPVKTAPAKTRVGFQVRMIFAAVNKLTDAGLDAHVVLARRLDSPRFRRIEMMTSKCYVHHFRIQSIRELDTEVESWLREAYRVGTQEHLAQ